MASFYPTHSPVTHLILMSREFFEVSVLCLIYMYKSSFRSVRRYHIRHSRNVVHEVYSLLYRPSKVLLPNLILVTDWTVKGILYSQSKGDGGVRIGMVV